jgi:hypothetical protein
VFGTSPFGNIMIVGPSARGWAPLPPPIGSMQMNGAPPRGSTRKRNAPESW